MRVVLVTGASRGIGATIAEELRRAGFAVVGLSRHRPPQWPGPYIETDLSTVKGLTELRTKLSDEVTDLWGLVNNAGVGSTGDLEDVRLDEFESVLRLNAVAPAVVAQTAIPLMRSGGRIVNVCSAVMGGRAGRSVYAASKAALASLTRTWALELAPRGITVNAISLGPIDTPMLRQAIPVGSAQEAAYLQDIPTHQVGDSQQVARLTGLILAPEMRYLTGAVLPLDGGLTAAIAASYSSSQ